MATKKVGLVGALSKLKPEDAARLAVYVVRGTEILAHGDVGAQGNFRVDVARCAADDHRFGLEIVVGPAGMAQHLSQVPELARMPLDAAALAKADATLELATDRLVISAARLLIWWRWCRKYCVSGTVVGPNGCPVPGARVTVNTVAHILGGYSKTPRVTVNADENGFFTACFNWCTCGICRLCWPCWPHWWLCWPWWWELDILHILENIERAPIKRPIGPGPVEGVPGALAMPRPAALDLMRGQAFASAHRTSAFAPDATRTELIKRKLANPAVRALFPWWWWCCDNPNITFTVTQAGTTILDENPATETRWCFPNNSTVVLVGNAQSITHCQGDPPPLSGFAWTRVGIIPVADIHAGYADAFGGTTDLAFGGTLDLYGGFAPGSGVSYYQVDAAQWSGDPSRGGTAPAAGSGSPISPDLYNYLYVFDASHMLVFNGPVRMGPFASGSLTNLYCTQEARPTAPVGPDLPAFPVIPAGGFYLWAYEDRKVYADASKLIAGASAGAVDLTLIGYDAGFAPVTLMPDTVLTLTIDNQPLTTQHINGVAAYSSAIGVLPKVPAVLTGTGDCPAYDLGAVGHVEIDMTVADANGHLYGYELDAEWGHGHTASVPPTPRNYGTPAVFPPLPYQSPDFVQRSFGGGNEILTYRPPTSCCYEFRIRAGKRVTDGYSGPGWGDGDFQTISLKVP